jgi:hypothetical protein
MRRVFYLFRIFIVVAVTPLGLIPISNANLINAQEISVTDRDGNAKSTRRERATFSMY